MAKQRGGWLKRLTEMRHGSRLRWLLLFSHQGARPSYDYRADVGTGIDASVIMAPIQWIQRAFPESRPIVQVRRRDEWEEAIDHPLTALLHNPNPAYTGFDLFSATIFSFATSGNAYWVKVRNRMGQPTQLWYVPHWMMDEDYPEDGSEFVSGYKYKPGRETIMLEPDDVVHFRHGVDPRNPRKGLSPLDSAIREIWTDMEAGQFVASLLRNNGITGIVLSPDSNESIEIEDADDVKRELKMKFTGEHRGEPLVMTSKTKVDRIGWNPQELDLSVARNVAEERVCALLGIPSAVVGFGSGMEQTQVGATMTELRRMAWNNGILPIQRHFALEIERSLLPAFRTQGARVRFDNSDVGALQEDRDAQFSRASSAVTAGWLTVASAKRMVGLEPEDGDDIYLRGISVIEVPVGGGQPQGLRASKPDGLKTQHSPLELRIAENAPRRSHSRASIRFMRTLAEMESAQADRFASQLVRFFEREADRISEVAEPLLEDRKELAPDDRLLAERILEEAGVEANPAVWRETYIAHYLEVARDVSSVMDVVGLGTDLPDPVARAVMQTGGRRAGLVDLSAQARNSLFNALTEGRAAGEGADALADRIRQGLAKGPWSSPEIRARVIARTETLHAQRVSVLEKGKDAGVQQFQIFDDRIGFGDDVCASMDGRIVSADEAQQLMADEHPNGTRSFTPYFGDD